MKDPLNLKAQQIIVQFPFNAPATEEKTEEELARIAERRREQGKKLQEIAAKARLEKANFVSLLEIAITLNTPV
jgi:actin-related protein 5